MQDIILKKNFFKELQKQSFENFDSYAYDKTDINTKNMIWSCYWYPLYGVKGNIPVIAFDSDYFDDENRLSILKNIFKDRGIKRVRVIPESEKAYIINDFAEVILDKDSDDSYDLPYFSEQFIYDDSKSWLLYTSHEATITFAGEWLVSEIKKRIQNCEQHMIVW